MRQLTHKSLIHKAYQPRTVAQNFFYFYKSLAKLNNRCRGFIYVVSMKIRYILVLLLLQLMAVLPAFAQTKAAKTDRVLFILDGSYAMNDTWQGEQSKFAIAAQVITRIIDSVNHNNGEVEFGLRVFGHQFNQSLSKCEDSRIEVAYSKDNLAQTALRLNDLKPKGAGSSSYAIARALSADVTDTAHYRYSMVLLQGSANDCAGDNCTELINSAKRNLLYRLYKIELGNDGTADKYCMDNVFEIKHIEDMGKSIQHISAQFRVRRPVVKETPVKKTAPVYEVKALPVIENKKTAPVVQSGTIPATADNVIPAVPFVSKTSKIKVEDPSDFGEINLLNIAAVKQMKIYMTSGDVEKEVMNIFPVGLNHKLVRLPVGKYALVYTYGYNDASKKIFEVLPEKVLDIPFR